MSDTLVKSTLNIKKESKEALEQLVKLKEISSVTEGVNLAIEKFIKEKEQEHYAAQMRKASLDEEYMNRTLGSQESFRYPDIEIDSVMVAEDGEW